MPDHYQVDEDIDEVEVESALNLTLKGSVGEFSIGAGHDSQHSVNVKYFLTHVGLDLSVGSNDALLSELAPVREVFDVDQLDFDQLMQRDIDDARVSGELIPYLLDSRSRDLVKLFPPIIVLVLPIAEDGTGPGTSYPEGWAGKVTRDNKEYHIQRSGDVGQEIFEFEQRINRGRPLDHDFAKLRLNTRKTKLVIVDGQHRAMALLALFRNMKNEWSASNRSAFKDYYAEWTPKYIEKFDIGKLKLPVMFCTFPTISAGYKGDMNLNGAARTVFLTLNKNARTVSTSRNILLNDRDLIAVFLRRTLSQIKNDQNGDSGHIRVHSIELDQFHDRLKLTAPLAITGVNHLHYIVEHLILNKLSDVNGAKGRSGNFSNRVSLKNSPAMNRLNGRNILGQSLADSTTREIFTEHAAEQLGKEFDVRFGKYIRRAFDTFEPFRVHSKAVVTLRDRVEELEDRRLIPILFGGQGIGRVFEAHRDSLASRISEKLVGDVAAAKEVKTSLDKTNRRKNKQIASFKFIRASSFVSQINSPKLVDNDEESIAPAVGTVVDQLYSNIFTTVAFQSALLCGFFSVFERISDSVENSWGYSSKIEDFFSEYIDQLNGFFVPANLKHLKRLSRLFVGEISSDAGNDPKNWQIAETLIGFKPIVIRGEMQPDQWPKYRYLILEVWKPTHQELSSVVESELEKSRETVFVTLYETHKKRMAAETARPVDDLTDDEKSQAFDSAANDFAQFIGLVSGSKSNAPTKAKMKGWTQEAVESDEEWDSEEVDE